MADVPTGFVAAPLFPAVPRGWKFPESTTAELSRRLDAAGPGATFHVLSYVKGDLMLLHLRVIGKDGAVAAEADLNDAFPCPPFVSCGGG